MKDRLLGAVSAFALLVTPALAEDYEMTTPVAPGVASPEFLETSIALLWLEDCVPTDWSTDKIYDNLDRSRALQAYLLGIPIVNQLSMRNTLKDYGAINTTDVIWEDLVDSKTVELTANDNVVCQREHDEWKPRSGNGKMSFLDTTRALAAPALIAAMAATTAPAQETTAPPPHNPLEKTIGQARPGIVPSLVVMNSAGASLADGKLTLTGIAGNSIVFADRPIRSAGHAPTSALLDEWNPDYPDNFHADPPNATVSAFGGSEKEVYDAVVVLRNAQRTAPVSPTYLVTKAMFEPALSCPPARHLPFAKEAISCCGYLAHQDC